MRSFKPTGHRHSAEIIQELTVDGQGPEVAFSATAIEAVRGILATSHVFLKDPYRRRRSGPSTVRPTRMNRSCGWSKKASVSIATRNRSSSPAPTGVTSASNAIPTQTAS